MQYIDDYVNEVLDIHLNSELIDQTSLGRLALFIREAYTLLYANLYEVPVVLAVLNRQSEFSSSQITKHLDLIRKSFHRKTILVTGNMPGISRRRLVEKRINFIVPGKQLYLPEFLVDLKDDINEQKKRDEKKALIPSAQLIILYYLLNHKDSSSITNRSFKQIADQFDYTPMAITKAVDDLYVHDLCEVTGTKEKHIHFHKEGEELWHAALPYLASPVLRNIYVDEKPPVDLVKSNLTALSQYSDINPSVQETYAIEKTIYYGLKKTNALRSENEYEGIYNLEIWKYNPLKLNANMPSVHYADPLSVYLSLQDMKDERIGMALQQIENTFIWLED